VDWHGSFVPGPEVIAPGPNRYLLRLGGLRRQLGEGVEKSLSQSLLVGRELSLASKHVEDSERFA
jgi:hypothetical protein